MDVKRLRVLAIVGPVAYLLLVELFSLLVLAPLLGNRPELRLVFVFLLLVAGAVPFSLWVFATIERQQRTLEERVAELARANEEINRRNRQLATVAIANARLYGEVRGARDRLQAWSEELEARVQERTREIAGYSKMLTTRVLQAQEEERKRIARELHDDTAQSLSTLLINLDLIAPQIAPEDAVLSSGFERVRDIAQRTLDATRALSHDLRPTILDDFGLVAALHWFADEYMSTFGVTTRVQAKPSRDGRLTPEIELALFRIAQEALTNTGKYAEATTASVCLTCMQGSVVLVVEDNGRGFDPNDRTGPTRHGGLGLYGMEERAALLGGRLRIESTPGKGTRVSAMIPLTVPEGEAVTAAQSTAPGDTQC